MKINQIVSWIKTDTIIETDLVLHPAGNIVHEMVGYKNKELTGNRQANWQRRILEKQKALCKQLEQYNRMRQRELQNKCYIKALKKI